MFPILEINPQLSIPTYFIYLSLLYIALLIWCYKRAAQFELPAMMAVDLFAVIMISGFIGARAFHVIFEESTYYKYYPWHIFYFWLGGFVFYGGAITAFLSVLIFVKIKKLKIKTWLDFFAPIVALGYGLGRGSCFLAGCCYGKSCSLPWAVAFPFDHIPRHPTQLYAVVFELLLFGFLVRWQKKDPSLLGTGLIFAAWLVGHAIGRLMMEFFRDDFRGAFYGGLSISSWISLALLGAGSYLGYRWSKNK